MWQRRKPSIGSGSNIISRSALSQRSYLAAVAWRTQLRAAGAWHIGSIITAAAKMALKRRCTRRVALAGGENQEKKGERK